MAALLSDWEDDATLVKGTCIRIEIVSEDGKLQDMYFQRPAKINKLWGSRETNEAFDNIMYECNRANNAEEKLRSFLNMQQHMVDLVDHLQYLDQLSSMISVAEHYPGDGVLRRLLHRPARILKQLSLVPLIVAQTIARGNSVWWMLSMALVLWIAVVILSDYSEDFMYSEFQLKFAGKTPTGFFGRPSNDHFDTGDPRH
eukprot:1755546-Prymnesium_polylepis.1